MQPAAEVLHVPVPGGALHALAWGDAAAPLLVFCHATGMCAELYGSLLAPLGARFRVVAYDARGHGLTDLPTDAAAILDDWLGYRDDLRALLRVLGHGPVLLAGHSLGATVALQAAVETPGLAHGVLLIEPAFVPFRLAADYRAARIAAAARAATTPPANPMADQALRRRAAFPSLAAMRSAYAGRGVFAGWSDSALDAYLAGGTVATAEGVRLACDPAWEASSFRGVSTSLEASMKSCRLPFVLLHGDIGSTVAPDDADAMAAMHPSATVKCLSGTGHFLPVTHPQLVRPWFELPALHQSAALADK